MGAVFGSPAAAGEVLALLGFVGDRLMVEYRAWSAIGALDIGASSKQEIGVFDGV